MQERTPLLSTVKLGRELLGRADEVAAAMNRDPKAQRHGQVTRSRVVRDALAIGLAALEEKWDVASDAAA